MKNRFPTIFTDSEGQGCIAVPLANSALRATLYIEDYNRLIREGLSPYWSLDFNKKNGQGYVRAAAKDGRKVAVARLIADAGPREQVRYRNRDRLNLRRENLRRQRGGTAKFDALSLIGPSE